MKKLLEDLKRYRKHAALIGIALALVCQVVPPQYRVVCDVVRQLCTLGM